MLTWNDALVNKIVEATKDGVADATNAVYEEILHLVQDTQKNGRIYKHRLHKGPHQASAPGEPYANETGNALKNTKTHEERQGLTGVISGKYEYVAYLEFGTSKMEPRPVFRPALANKTKDVLNAIRNEVAKAIK